MGRVDLRGVPPVLAEGDAAERRAVHGAASAGVGWRMRRRAAIDRNQPDIVKRLRAVGCTVQPLHSVGGGCPDLLVGFQGRNVLLELKDGDKPPSAQRLTDDQAEWHAVWRGQVAVVNSIEGALAALGIEVTR